MRRASNAFGLFLLALMVSPALAVDPPSTDKKPETKDDTDQIVTTGNLIGQLTQVDLEKRTFTLKVTARVQVVNHGAVAARASLLQQLNDAGKIADPKQRQGRINDLRNQLAKNEGDLIKIKEKSQDLQLHAHDDMKVRTLILPPVFDDKGFPRKYTTDELNNLRTPPGLPGFQAALSDVHEKQYVQVFMGGKKDDATKKTEAPKDPKDTKDSKDTKDPKEAPRLTVIVMVIVGKPE